MHADRREAWLITAVLRMDILRINRLLRYVSVKTEMKWRSTSVYGEVCYRLKQLSVMLVHSLL